MSSVTATAPGPLNRAFTAFQPGDLTGAGGFCREVLAKRAQTDSLYFDALHLLAAAQFRTGRPAEALANYKAAIWPEAAVGAALCGLVTLFL
jgi:hypothetical protein